MFHVGVVEDNKEPLKAGRLKVRVFGIHTDNKSEDGEPFDTITTEDLPWCLPAAPITNSSIDGISDFSGILAGTKVFVFFIDKYQQKPFYFAVMPFILDKLPDFEKGFSDPDEEHPKDEYKDESSISRLARAEKLDETINKTKTDNLSTWTNNGNDIEEPESTYNAEYPHNRVIETPSGIIIELDSTEDAERIHIYHPSNSYMEIDTDGNKVTKTNKNKFDITIGDSHTLIKGFMSVTVEGDAMIDVAGDTLITCQGKSNINLEEESVIVAKSTLAIEAQDDMSIHALKKLAIVADDDLLVWGKNVIVESTETMLVKSASTMTIESNASMSIQSNSSIYITSAGEIVATGSIIRLN